MKKSKHSKFHLLILLLAISNTEVRANPESDAKSVGQEIIDNVKDIESINQNAKNVGKIDVPCPACTEVKVNKNIVLDAETLDLGNPHYRKNDEPYIIHLKRTSKSPKKIDLTFKNGHEYCGKMFVGTNPWYPSGPLVIDCVIYLTRYEEAEISLNMKNLKPLKDGEEEIIEVKLSKTNIKNAKFNLEVKNISNPDTRVDLGKKFFGNGYNVSVETP